MLYGMALGGAWLLSIVLAIMLLAGLAVTVSAPFRQGSQTDLRNEAIGGLIMSALCLLAMVGISALMSMTKP